MNVPPYIRTRLNEVCQELWALRCGPLPYNHKRVLRLQAERRAFTAYITGARHRG